jgi:hypothetical protein
MIFRVMILLALVKLLDMTNSPGLCTFLLAAAITAFRLAFSPGYLVAVVTAVLSLIIYGLYFWLLNRYNRGIWYWLIFIVGLPICLII